MPAAATSHLSRLLIVLLAALLLAPAARAAEPLRILPIGDSITQGGKADREEYTYRYPLFTILTDAGVAFDLIGTRQAGLQPAAKWPDHKGKPFDADHEGYYGAKTAVVRDKLKAVLPKLPPPDVALIHLGTNDQEADDFSAAIVKPLEEMVAMLRERNPKVVVLIGHLNFNGGAAVKIRPLVQEMTGRLSTKESPVEAVHHYRGWKENPKAVGTDTFDWAHPNPQGQRKMAEAWLAAMAEHVPAVREKVKPNAPAPGKASGGGKENGKADQKPNPADPFAGLQRVNGFVVTGHAWTWGKGTLFEAIDATRAAGLDALEVYLMGMPISRETGDAVLNEDTPDELLEKIKAKGREANVRIVNAYIGQAQWTRIGTDEAALRKFFDLGKKLGLTGFTGEPAEYQWDMIEKLLKEYDFTFAVHNHAKGFEADYFRGPYRYWDPRYTAEKLKGRDERFGISLDTGHVARSNLDNTEVLKAIAGRVQSVHLKDIKEPKPEAHDVLYGDGVVDIKALLAELRRQKFDGHIALEYEWFESPTFNTDVKKLVEYIRGAE